MKNTETPDAKMNTPVAEEPQFGGIALSRMPGYVLRDLWIEDKISQEAYSGELFRRAKEVSDRQDHISRLEAALKPFAEFRTASHVGSYADEIREHFTPEQFAEARAALAAAEASDA